MSEKREEIIFLHRISIQNDFCYYNCYHYYMHIIYNKDIHFFSSFQTVALPVKHIDSISAQKTYTYYVSVSQII